MPLLLFSYLLQEEKTIIRKRSNRKEITKRNSFALDVGEATINRLQNADENMRKVCVNNKQQNSRID